LRAGFDSASLSSSLLLLSLADDDDEDEAEEPVKGSVGFPAEFLKEVLFVVRFRSASATLLGTDLALASASSSELLDSSSDEESTTSSLSLEPTFEFSLLAIDAIFACFPLLSLGFAADFTFSKATFSSEMIGF
jgi:hypothetical protein